MLCMRLRRYKFTGATVSGHIPTVKSAVFPLPCRSLYRAQSSFCVAWYRQPTLTRYDAVTRRNECFSHPDAYEINLIRRLNVVDRSPTLDVWRRPDKQTRSPFNWVHTVYTHLPRLFRENGNSHQLPRRTNIASTVVKVRGPKGSVPCSDLSPLQ